MPGSGGSDPFQVKLKNAELRQKESDNPDEPQVDADVGK